MTQTLFALATPAGRSAVAVVRLSGPAVAQVVRGLAGRLPAPRRASLRTLRDAAGAPLDRALVLWFPGPASFTGEDSAELHLHGGPAVVEAVSEALLAAGLAPAGPGAFTRRAFENGRLDLDQAEAIADLVDAESGAQARQALRQLEGALGLRYQAWRETLVTALAFLEAVVDFPDEEIPAETLAAARGPLEALGAALDAALIDEGRGRRVREGWRVAVIGRPNAGKSSLFNALIGRAAAIVTAVPGTTRDVVEAPLTLAGYRLLLADTAGVRLTDDPIEAEGVRRARQWAADADLRLWVADRSADAGLGEEAAVLLRAGDVLIAGKADLAESADWVGTLREAQSLGLEVWPFSAMAGEAEAVLARLAARVTGALAGAEFPAVTRARHAVLLREARDHLARALRGLMEPELAAEDVRLAARALERITGRIGAEDVLDRVFASFCIGK